MVPSTMVTFPGRSPSGRGVSLTLRAWVAHSCVAFLFFFFVTSQAQQVKGVPNPNTFQPLGQQKQQQPQQRRNPDVDKWITELSKRPLCDVSLDGLKPGEGEKFVDLQAKVKLMEPYMLFDLAECTIQERLAIEDARLRYYGRHLQGRALAVFNKAYAQQFSNRAMYGHGIDRYEPDLIYREVLHEVEEAVYFGNTQEQYFIDRLERLKQHSSVEQYNKAFLGTMAYLPPDELGPRACWK